MTSEERDDNYWMGVRDALRMVDSFLRWARKHPKDAKTIDDFLAEGLIAAAKRCVTCLGKELGMKYGSKDPDVDEPRHIEEPAHFEEPIPLSGPEHTSMPAAEEDAVEVPETPVSRETGEGSEAEIEPKTESEMISIEPISIDGLESDAIEEPIPPPDNLTFEGIKRDFESDFSMGVPESLEADASDVEPEPETLEEVMRSVMEEALSSDDLDEEESVEAESDSYEDVLEVIEASEPAEVEVVVESETTSAPPKRDLWSPYDEPSISSGAKEDDSSMISDEEDAGESIEDEADSTSRPKPPPPPPPPETDESEEERRRRARRLFFGT
ncbi:MAG: hypothetical protein ACFFD6_04515 [Candidatus Thorarchaeota archaeon]